MVSYKTVMIIAAVVYGLGVIASLIEALILKFVAKRAYDSRAALASFAVIVGRLPVDLLTPISITMPGAFWLYQHRLLEPAELGAWSYVLLFLGVEFIFYWLHRISHRSRWFWLSHVTHHTPNELNISASYRLGWTARIMGTYAMLGPLALLGFEPQMLIAAYAVNLGYQMWLHTDWIPKLGFLEGVLNTPSSHRVHHAANLEYLDANYGGVLVVFDRMFGTYRPERDDTPIRYGLVEPLRSYNPLKLVFYQFIPMFRDLRSARSLREVLGYLFGPPGWRPDGNGKTTEDLRRRAAALT